MNFRWLNCNKTRFQREHFNSVDIDFMLTKDFVFSVLIMFKLIFVRWGNKSQNLWRQTIDRTRDDETKIDQTHLKCRFRVAQTVRLIWRLQVCFNVCCGSESTRSSDKCSRKYSQTEITLNGFFGVFLEERDDDETRAEVRWSNFIF